MPPTVAEPPEQVVKVGGDVSAPIPIYTVEPAFSEEAREANFSGEYCCGLWWWMRRAQPINVHIVKGVGMGLDEKAVAAVKQYRFKPAMKGGKPVAVAL